MKVILGSTSSITFSGASKALVELGTNLKKRGIDVEVILNEHGKLEEELNRAGIRWKIFKEYNNWYKIRDSPNSMPKYWVKRGFNYFNRIRIKRYLKKAKPDVVHMNAATAYNLGKSAEELHLPVVWHLREFLEEDLNVTFTNEKYSKKILNKASVAIAISKAVKQKWRTRLLDTQIKVVYDGLPVENYLIKNKKSDSTKKIILYGRIVPGKGQLFYLQGMKEILAKNKNVSIYFAGKIEDQEYFERCQNYIKKENLGDKITYLGEQKNIKKLLLDKDIVCVCSQREGFGRVTVEGILGKSLVIGAKSGATIEIIKDGKNGYLYKPNDLNDFVKKVQKGLDNLSNFKLSLAQEAAIKEYSINKNIERIISIYKKLEREKKDGKS